MPEQVVLLKEAFGVGRDVPLNYVARPNVDGEFLDSLTREKHVVIYGSSKQGKTTLRRHCLDDADYIVISCVNTMSLADLNGAILKAAGYRIQQTFTKTVGGAWKFGAEFVGEGKVPFFAKASAKTTGARETTDQRAETTRKLEIDISDVNDIIMALQEIKFSKFIILEDFHYLSADVQKSFSFALKAYHENSKLCFVIVGVWRDKNRLIYYNGDLTNRVVSVDVDVWSNEHLREVISVSEALLNIKIDEEAIRGVIYHSGDSVALVQEACYRICKSADILQTCDELTDVGRGVDAEKIVREIVNDQAGRYSAFITNFSEGFQPTPLEMYKWVAYAVLVSPIEALESGLRRQQVALIIKNKHPEGLKLNEGNITQALQNTASLQVLKSIRPIIFDYDQTTRVLTVVDRSFLIWLAHQDREELLAEVGIE
ncbi:hypothetical protein [Methylobacterium sp. Leaf106]|uniref:Uncharacterized protein n=1 Tax=Methylobacterium bullatum TaxID=570505 RepID=A0A679IQ37_9HYPH|nr:hypothetical protein [Methylobacterium sp. Leaf106]CAA2102132.1 hypothetical protein MBUL_01530 [Methylobacterium bullatum]